MIPRLIPLIIAFLLLGAHFLRGGTFVIAAACVLVPLLLIIKNRRLLFFVQWLTYAGAAVWAHTAYVLVRQRMDAGLSWARLLLILSGVALFTFYAGYLLSSDRVKGRYN